MRAAPALSSVPASAAAPSWPEREQPRRFTASALPGGDPEFGVTGPLVLVVERGLGQASQRRAAPETKSLRFYTVEEAEALGRALLEAAARAVLKPVRAAPGTFPVTETFDG